MREFFAWVIVVVLIFLLLPVIKEKRKKRMRAKNRGSGILVSEYKDMNFLPYELNKTLLTSHEAVLYNRMTLIAQKYNLVICVKPRIADFISVTLNQYEKGTDFYRYFNRISAKHVDFLLCNGFSLKPVLAVELDDGSHDKKHRMERDEFVDLVYHVVELNVIHFKKLPLEDEIEKEINKHIDIQGISA